MGNTVYVNSLKVENLVTGESSYQIQWVDSYGENFYDVEIPIVDDSYLIELFQEYDEGSDYPLSEALSGSRAVVINGTRYEISDGEIMWDGD